jgi:hypothetical protein
MEALGFAALTLGAILANCIRHEPEIWQAARPREGIRGTSVLSLPPAWLAWRQTALDLCPPLLLGSFLIAPVGASCSGSVS